MKKGKYIGARYIAEEPIFLGGICMTLTKGIVTTILTEEEAIGRRDFEPVYSECELVSEDEGKLKNKKTEVKQNELLSK